MTEDIPLEITSSDMANLPIFIAVLIVAAVIARICVSVKRKDSRLFFAPFGARRSSSRSAW